MTDIKSVVAGNERRILSALGITLHRHPNQRIRCPYPDHQKSIHRGDGTTPNAWRFAHDAAAGVDLL
jgi:hypothetical protein